MGETIDTRDDHDDDLQETEEVETLSLTDFPVTQDHDDQASRSQDHRQNPSSDELFEFFHGGFGDYSGQNTMSHAEDIIFCGRLVPINEQRRRKPPPRQPAHCRRSESMSDVKNTTITATPSPLVRNSRSLDYKKLYRNSSMSSEPAPTPEMQRNVSGKKSSSSRWCVLMFGLAKVPPEMDLRDIKNRQIRRSTSKSLFPSFESGDKIPASGGFDHRKSSWRILGILSCKSSASVAVTTPLACLP